MAKSSVLNLVVLLITLAISKSHQHEKNDLKSLHFTLYGHDIFNKTDFLIVPGVAGANLSTATAPFGTITVVRDPLTATLDPKSEVHGTVESMAIASSFDGLDSITFGRVDLNLKDGHKGTLSVLGVVNTFKPSDYPVVGGTGDFLFVQGYITSTVLSLKNFKYAYQQDFHLYWPLYAAYAI